jgi:hypothetical protein
MKQAQERIFCPIIPAFVVKRSMRAAIAFRLFISLRRETLPTRATGLAFEGPNDFVRYPTAIKSTGLGAHGLARHNAVTFRWVKGIPACHFREGLGGFGDSAKRGAGLDSESTPPAPSIRSTRRHPPVRGER